jgi:hypothetical protein
LHASVYEVSEYYLSRHRASHLTPVPDDATLIIISDDPGFASNVTEITLFIMMTSFTSGMSAHQRKQQTHIQIA